MRRGLRTVLAVLATIVLTAQAWALAPQERVENFRLLDHEGNSHELYYYSDAKAVVVMVQGNSCPIVRNAMPRYKQLRDQYASLGVQFFLLNSNLQDNRQKVSREAEEFGFDIPVLLDDTQIIGESLNLVRMSEVFVLDPKDWSVTYHGALDDRLTYENQKKKASKHYLKDALDAMLAGKPVAVPSTEAQGCLINFPEKRNRAHHASISYAKEIAPLLAKNCVACHRDGGIGPFAMTDYDMVQGFSLMIREVVRTKRMPPWHADPAYGHFSNDRSLTAAEQQKLVHWIEAGAPRGKGEDPLAAIDHDWPQWNGESKMGPPDLVLEIPAANVPATGVVDYIYQNVDNPLDRDVWVKASEIVPGDRSVLHHVITRFGKMETEGRRKGRLKRRGGGGLAGYVPGYVARPLPDGTGTFLPVGSTIQFQMHYTTTGKAVVDKSKLGIWFHKEKPKHAINGLVWINRDINIPAHDKNHSEAAEHTIEREALLYTLLPHAHFRGKASNFIAYYPDGTEEMLLSVPNYDFNWQTTYLLEKPKHIPAGTRIVHTTWWDNSAQNPANPDPTRDVSWGQQSWDEMLFGAGSLRYLTDEEVADHKANQKLSLTN